jgi:hypothetical protein
MIDKKVNTVNSKDNDVGNDKLNNIDKTEIMSTKAVEKQILLTMENISYTARQVLYRNNPFLSNHNVHSPNINSPPENSLLENVENILNTKSGASIKRTFETDNLAPKMSFSNPISITISATGTTSDETSKISTPVQEITAQQLAQFVNNLSDAYKQSILQRLSPEDFDKVII